MLTTGRRAPDFSLPNENGETVTLGSLIGDGPLILYFYPADFTPGCTKEACSIRDIHGELVAAGLRVVGVSPQDAESHVRFRDQYNLPFSLLSDENKDTIKSYDADGPFGVGVRRITYLIDADGLIADAIQADILVGRHTDFIRNAINLQQRAG